MRTINFSKLSSADQELLLAARDAMAQAYNPYSNFFVGAALRAVNGEIVTGSNFENASYSATILARLASSCR